MHCPMSVHYRNHFAGATDIVRWSIRLLPLRSILNCLKADAAGVVMVVSLILFVEICVCDRGDTSSYVYMSSQLVWWCRLQYT
jgi:hypothetical protein